MRDKIFTAARDAVNPKPAQVFYTSPIAIARILCSGFFFAIASMYAVMFFLMPVAEASALALPMLPLVAVGILGEIALAFVLSRLSPLRVDDSGISMTDIWGRKRTLSWGEIETVTPTNYLSQPYLKVSSFRKDRTAFLLPLNVTRPQEFRDAISHCASPVHPLRRFMEEGEASAQREPLA